VVVIGWIGGLGRHAPAAADRAGLLSNVEGLTDDRRSSGVGGDHPGAFCGGAGVPAEAGVVLSLIFLNLRSCHLLLHQEWQKDESLNRLLINAINFPMSWNY
jgi:hypothetical protein